MSSELFTLKIGTFTTLQLLRFAFSLSWHGVLFMIQMTILGLIPL
jgi:hypothetical protein